MTLNFFYHFQLIPFQKIFYSCKILYPTFLHGWPQTFYLSTLLKLNFFLLDFLHNFLKFTIPHLQFLQIQQYNLFLLLKILVLSLILIFLFLIISHTFRNLASLIFVICDVFVILQITKQPALLQLLSFTLNQTTVTLFISTSVINNSIGFNSFSTLLLVLSQKLQNSITLLLISNHFTGSKLRNAYNTKFFH